MTLRYVIKELRYHHHRTLVNIFGIAVGISLFVAINSLSAAYQGALQLPFRNIGADLVLQKPETRQENAARLTTVMQGVRLPFSNQLLTSEELGRLALVKGLAGRSASLLLWEFSQGGFRTIMGVDLAQPGLGPVKVKDWLAEGRFLQKSGEVILEKHYAKFHKVKLHDSITIGNRQFKVVGLLAIKEGAQIVAANAYLPIDDARALLGSGRDSVNVVYLRLADPSLQSRVRSEIDRVLPGMSVASSDSSLEVMGGVSKISGQFGLIVSIVSVAGAILLVIRSMVANLIARTSQIGILKAVGWTGKDVHRQIRGETLIQSLAGGILGLVIGYSVAFLFARMPVDVATPAQMNQIPSMARNVEKAVSTAVTLPLQISVELVAAALVIALLSGLLASYIMGRRTDKMKPSDILRKL
jgi:putative ABC transport system permease protein